MRRHLICASSVRQYPQQAKMVSQRQRLLLVMRFIALSAVLSLQPGDATAQEILAVLQEKVQLDAESDQSKDDDEASSEQDSSSSEEGDSEDSNGRQAAGNEQSEEEADSLQSPAETPPKQCAGLQEAPPAAPGSAESRMQLKQALKEQIEDLRVQQAAAAMQKLNPLL